eukprot:symbB.v1.2.003503.t1/scaffold197.1/size274157/10
MFPSLSCRHAKAHVFLASFNQKYMYEADEGPIKAPVVPRGPVVDQEGHITGTTVGQNSGLPSDKEMAQVPPGTQVPLGNVPAPKGPDRIFRTDGPVDHKMDEEADKAEEELEAEVQDIADEDLKGVEENAVDDKEAPR